MCEKADSAPIVLSGHGLPESMEGVETPLKARKSNKTGNIDRKSTRLNSSHRCISYAVFCLKKNHDADVTQDADEPHHARHDRKIREDHRSPDFDRHENDEEEAQEGHEEERRYEEHHDEERSGSCLDSRPRHQVIAKQLRASERPRTSGAFSCSGQGCARPTRVSLRVSSRNA